MAAPARVCCWVTGMAAFSRNELSPTVQAITRAKPIDSDTSSTSVSFTVTFNEAVSGVDAGDFVLALSNVTVADPLIVTSLSGSVYTVTVNGIAGGGSLRLNLVDDG